ncbi:hypothetical protein ACI782_20745 [Geodermatophilus sp. SYSU D00703]
MDTTGNALPDVWGADSGLDGSVDAVAHDVDDDGAADWSEPFTTAASAHASVRYVFAEADGWVYWEVATGSATPTA